MIAWFFHYRLANNCTNWSKLGSVFGLIRWTHEVNTSYSVPLCYKNTTSPYNPIGWFMKSKSRGKTPELHFCGTWSDWGIRETKMQSLCQMRLRLIVRLWRPWRKWTPVIMYWESNGIRTDIILLSLVANIKPWLFVTFDLTTVLQLLPIPWSRHLTEHFITYTDVKSLPLT